MFVFRVRGFVIFHVCAVFFPSSVALTDEGRAGQILRAGTPREAPALQALPRLVGQRQLCEYESRVIMCHMFVSADVLTARFLQGKKKKRKRARMEMKLEGEAMFAVFFVTM